MTFPKFATLDQLVELFDANDLGDYLASLTESHVADLP